MIDPASLPEFLDIGRCIRWHARQAPHGAALVVGEEVCSYAALDRQMDRVAAALRSGGLVPGDAIALCSATSTASATVFLAALRAGLVVAPLAPSSTPQALQRMLADADARVVFVDGDTRLGNGGPPRVALDESADAGEPLARWLARHGASLEPEGSERKDDDAPIAPEAPFNIIYSSGTTGEPKGIVQPHAMRWSYARRAHRFGYGGGTVTLLSTPLYSNTTLVVFFPTLSFGGTVVLMPRFEPAGWLHLAQRHRVTHAMLVPVQYERLLACPDFDRTDLSSFRFKFSTSAPFRAELKAEVLRRWPGGLAEFYGMTEGGASCILEAHLHPDKLHTVGRPAPGHEFRFIDEQGLELPPGQAGELVGRSPTMMTGYHKRPEATREAEWFDGQGRRFIRTGDVGRIDADGFITLVDRRKDVIISGGFNVYPSDLEPVLRAHPQVADVAVVGVPSERWGETPVAFVVPRQGDAALPPQALRDWANERLGRTQRLHAVRFVQALPRSAIGKVLRRELQQAWARAGAIDS